MYDHGKIEINFGLIITTQRPAEAPDYLQSLDRITQSILTSILQHQRNDPEVKQVKIDGTEVDLQLPYASVVSLPQLQRLRRQFVDIVRKGRASSGESIKVERVPAAFVEFLNESME
jgi:protein KTI12